MLLGPIIAKGGPNLAQRMAEGLRLAGLPD